MRNPFLETQEVSFVASAPATAIVARDPSRRLLQVQNNGGSPMKYRFGAAPDANNGLTLVAGAVATYDVAVPIGDLFVTAGSSVFVFFG